MAILKRFVFIIISVSFVLVMAAESYSQGLVQRRRIVREQFKQVEVYFDGGYFIGGMGPADDAMQRGWDALADTFDLAVSYGIGYYDGYNQEFKGVRSMGGGLNLNLTPDYGLGLKFLFTGHNATSNIVYTIDSTEVFIPNTGNLIVGIDQSFITRYRYHQAPIIVHAFYKFRPFPIDNLSFTVGGGPGVYVTSVQINYEYRSHRYDIINDPPRLNPPDNFVKFYDRAVVKPIGAYLFGSMNLKGSSAVSFSLNAEYHYVPETDIKKWHSRQDFQAYPYEENDPFMINPETEEPMINPATGKPITTGYYFQSLLSGYKPDKLNISGLRLSAALTFSF